MPVVIKSIYLLTIICSLPLLSAKWYLVWSDEFSGSTINTDNWSIQVSNENGNVNKNLQYYTGSNVHISSGILSLTARSEAYSGPLGLASYTSGAINSQWKVGFAYGKWEARMKLPNIQGLWSSFALNPTYNVYGTWARSGEIIPVNQIGGDPDNLNAGAYFGDYGEANVYSGTEYKASNLSQSFHIYGLEWSPDQLKFYLDGVNYYNISQWFTPGHAKPAPFDQIFYLGFSLAVGGYFPGSPPSTFPSTGASLQVDWVRVYQNATHNATFVDSPPSSTSSTTFGVSQIIVIAVVLAVVLVALIALRYFYVWTLRKRAYSEAPPLETLGAGVTSPDRKEVNPKYPSETIGASTVAPPTAFAGRADSAARVALTQQAVQIRTARSKSRVGSASPDTQPVDLEWSPGRGTLGGEAVVGIAYSELQSHPDETM